MNTVSTWIIFLAVLLCNLIPANAQSTKNNAGVISVEKLTGVDTFTDFVVSKKGHRLHTIITKPKGAEGRLPAILFVQWLSCDSVVIPSKRKDGWSQMLRGLIDHSGMVFIRTDKAGIGKSEGPPCGELDYNTELEGYKATLEWLKQSSHVDPNNIIIYGASMGGNMAPLIAQDQNIRGIMIWGTTSLTWAEHMIAIDRRSLELKGTPPEKVNEYMDEHIEFHTKYLIGQQMPADIIAQKHKLAEAWNRMLGTGPVHQYGRAIAFHHQAHQANWEAAWATIDVPILVVHGEYDWIMGPEEHQRIVKIVNGNYPGKAKLVTIPKMDHHFEVYDTPELAFVGRGGKFDDEVVNVFLDWLNNFEETR